MENFIKIEAEKCRQWLIDNGYNVSNLDDIDILEKYYEILSQKETD